MTEHIDKWLEEWLAGRLPEERERELDAHTSECQRCTKLYREEAEAIAAVARSLPAEEPSAGLKARIMGSLSEANRFRKFAQKTAELIDVGLEEARNLLGGIDDAANWYPGPAAGVSLYEIEGGPKTAESIVGFIRVDAGSSFPEHEHHGAETVFVLQGELRDSGGSLFGPGEVSVMDEGSTHHLHASDDAPLIFLAVIERGVDIDGEFIGPGDSRL